MKYWFSGKLGGTKLANVESREESMKKSATKTMKDKADNTHAATEAERMEAYMNELTGISRFLAAFWCLVQ